MGGEVGIWRIIGICERYIKKTLFLTVLRTEKFEIMTMCFVTCSESDNTRRPITVFVLVYF